MDPLILTATVISSLITTKTLEKTGEVLGETLVKQTNKLLSEIRNKIPSAAAAIDHIHQQPLDYPQVVRDVELVVKNDPEFAETLAEMGEIIRAELVAENLIEMKEAILSGDSIFAGRDRIANKVGIIIQGGTVKIDNFNF